MYVPSHFAEVEPEKLHAFIVAHSFGVLASTVGGAPFASHLPFLLERSSGTHGTLVGHMARTNPQWRELAGQTVLAIFSGPHAYISPSWYEAERVVPTWNYAAVHAAGPAQVIEENAELLDIVKRTVGVYESGMPVPWTLDESGTFVEKMLGQIVGFRIEIATLEGKWKMSQNHPVERREKVIRALTDLGGAESLAVAEMIRQTLPHT